jgi:methionine sulfoxide reductase heme-binding subunit
MADASDIRFTKFLILSNGAVPLALLAWDGFNGNIGANPMEFIIRSTGIMTLLFLAVTLAVTPLRKTLDKPWLGKLRRMVGLYAFFYGCLHLIAYSGFDKSFKLGDIWIDTLRRPFIFLGMLGYLVMVPLAVTSTNGMIKRLGGKRWNQLHKLTYVAAAAGALHYYLLVKSDRTYPLAFIVVIGALLSYRIITAPAVSGPLGLTAPRKTGK